MTTPLQSSTEVQVLTRVVHCHSSASVSLFAGLLLALPASGVERIGVVEDYSNPPAWFYNRCGGNHGVSGSSAPSVSQPRAGVWRIAATGAGFIGTWEGLNHNTADHLPFDPAAVFPSMIKSGFQPRMTGMEVDVESITSLAANPNLSLTMELKGWSGASEVGRWSRAFSNAELTAAAFPRTLSAAVPPTTTLPVGLAGVILDNVQAGDAMEISAVRLKFDVPGMTDEMESFVFSFAMLLANYDPLTGMVQDRSNFSFGTFENVSATAKLAKITALAIQKGVADPVQGSALIRKIATSLLTNVPRYRGLWPHFTKSAGTQLADGSQIEYASGDTSYAILDLMVALRMIGDPDGKLPSCISFVQAIDWADLRRTGHGYSHGYKRDLTPLSGTWEGFGMETIGVMLCAMMDGNPASEMHVPPTDNGSGFILHAHYPLVPRGIDAWGNNWTSLRQTEMTTQLGWYSDIAHSNPFLVSAKLAGLSGSERADAATFTGPSDQIYQAYGIGGLLAAANDGDHKIVAAHYGGMISAFAPLAAADMWKEFRARNLMSPINMVESIAINPSSGATEALNALRGSWNLALFAEGWAMADPHVEDAVKIAVQSITPLASAWNSLFPNDPPQSSQTIIAARSAPLAGGSTSGSGTFAFGASVTVTAVPSPGYTFVNWTEAGNPVSTSAGYTFTAGGNRTLIANFTTAGSPTIAITSVPTFGSADTVTGVVTGVNFASYRVAAYIYIDGAGWWTKPSFAAPVVPINADGTFTVSLTNPGGSDNVAEIFAVALISSANTPVQASGAPGVPADPNFVATAFKERYGRTLSFAGRTWAVKKSLTPVGPSVPATPINYFSDLPSDVWVDGAGLHLTIHQTGGIWYSTEVILPGTLGYGTYVFKTASRVDTMDQNAVLGMYSWDPYGDDTVIAAWPFREIDIEDSRWGNPSGPNSQYVIQPYNVGGNRSQFALPDLSTNAALTRAFTWQPGVASFVTLTGNQSASAVLAAAPAFTYTTNGTLNHYVPSTGRENLHLNLWLNNASGPAAPSNGQPVEVVISDFTFIPANAEIAVEQPAGTNLTDAMASTSFGNVRTGTAADIAFTIKNTGASDLTGLGVTIDGVNASDFTVVSNPVAPVSGPSGSATLMVRFAPLTAGAKTAFLHIASNDADESSFDIALGGTGIVVGTKAQLTSPINGTTLASTTLPLVWNAGTGVTSYYLFVGTSPGGHDVYAGSQGTNQNTTVTVPAGRTIHVTLWSLINGAYQGSYYVFNAPAAVKAALVSPADGSTLGGNQLALTWTAGTGVSSYAVWVGSAYSGYDLGAMATAGTSTTFTVPQDGGPIYVTLWSLINGGWQGNNYWFNTALPVSGSRQARITSPANASMLGSATMNLVWDAGSGVTSYALWAGSTPNGYDLYSGLEGTSLSKSVAIPGDGRRVHVTLHSLIAGAYQSNSYWFTAPTLPDGGAAQVASPASGGTLADATLPLVWSSAAGATQYYLFAGSTPGGYDLYAGSQGTALNRTLTGMPLDGRVIYVTLYSWLNGAWKQSSAWFTAANTAIGNKRALITSPANGTTLPGASATFNWGGGTGVTSYALWIGSSAGAYDLWSSAETLATTSRTVTLPTDGRKLYVTLYSLISGAWQGASYFYTAANVAVTKAAIVSPANGSTLAGATQTFTWSANNAATMYALWIGRTPVGNDVYAGAEGTNLAKTVSTLPTDGSPLYVTLWSLIKGAWLSNAYIYQTGVQ